MVSWNNLYMLLLYPIDLSRIHRLIWVYQRDHTLFLNQFIREITHLFWTIANLSDAQIWALTSKCLKMRIILSDQTVNDSYLYKSLCQEHSENTGITMVFVGKFLFLQVVKGIWTVVKMINKLLNYVKLSWHIGNSKAPK